MAMAYHAGRIPGPIMRHALTAVFVAAALFGAGPLRAQTAPTSSVPPEALAAARELVQTMKATDQFRSLLPTILEGLKPAIVQGRPEKWRKDYDAIMPIIISGAMQRLNGLADIMAVVYAQNFSVDELHDLTAFYRTPTGQKLVARQPVIARATMVAGQQFAITLGSDLKQQITDELLKREGGVSGQPTTGGWGALAVGVSPDNFQSAAAPVVGKATEDQAREAALALCRTGKGGTDQARSHCTVVGTFQNQCFALAGRGWSIAADEEAARVEAVAKCRSSPCMLKTGPCSPVTISARCKVGSSGCSGEAGSHINAGAN
jgi:uncharacterized protein